MLFLVLQVFKPTYTGIMAWGYRVVGYGACGLRFKVPHFDGFRNGIIKCTMPTRP